MNHKLLSFIILWNLIYLYWTLSNEMFWIEIIIFDIYTILMLGLLVSEDKDKIKLEALK